MRANRSVRTLVFGFTSRTFNFLVARYDTNIPNVAAKLFCGSVAPKRPTPGKRVYQELSRSLHLDFLPNCLTNEFPHNYRHTSSAPARSTTGPPEAQSIENAP